MLHVLRKGQVPTLGFLPPALRPCEMAPSPAPAMFLYHSFSYEDIKSERDLDIPICLSVGGQYLSKELGVIR